MIIKAKVKPNSPNFKVVQKEGYIEVHLRSEPEKGKANAELVKELSKIYGSCKIIRGKTSKNKIIEV